MVKLYPLLWVETMGLLTLSTYITYSYFIHNKITQILLFKDSMWRVTYHTFCYVMKTFLWIWSAQAWTQLSSVCVLHKCFITELHFPLAIFCPAFILRKSLTKLPRLPLNSLCIFSKPWTLNQSSYLSCSNSLYYKAVQSKLTLMTTKKICQTFRK